MSGGAIDASAPIEILPVGRSAYAIAWSAPWGAAALLLRRFAEDASRHALLLGSAERTRRDAPRLFHLGDGVGVAWCEDDGAYLAAIGEAGIVRAPQLLVPRGRSLCLAAGRRATHVLVEDGEAIHAVEVRSDGTSTRAPEPLIEQAGRVRMAAARAGGSSLLFAAYEHDPRLAIVDASAGARSRVRHDLPAPCGAIDAYGMGSRAAFAITYEGVGIGEDELVEAGVVDAAGKMIERRHAVLRTPGALYADVRVGWIEEGFHAIARDARHDRATIVRIGDRRPLFDVAKVRGPFAAAYHEKRFVLAQAIASGDAPTLRLFTCDQRGGQGQTIDLREPAPDAVRERRADARAERCIDDLEAALGGAGYRDAPGARVHLARGAGLALAADGQRVEIVPDADRYRLVLSQLSSAAAGGAREPVARPVGGLERVARWIRGRIPGAARQRAEADRALALELAASIDGELARVARGEAGLRIEIVLRDPPEGARLSAWLHDARRRLAAPEPTGC